MMRNRKYQTSSVNIHFEGGLSTQLRASLINEFIKHILFRRQQIPMTYEQLKAMLEQAQDQDGNEDKNIGYTCCHGYKKLRNKRVGILIDELDSVFNSINEAFSHSRGIERVMILVGGSIVSPKETYIVYLTPMDPDVGAELSLKSYLRLLFRELFAQDFFINVGDLSPTNVTVMFLAARDTNLAKFHTKPNYRTPTRGHVLHVFLETGGAASSQELSRASQSEDFNISGIEPINLSVSCDLDTGSIVDLETADDSSNQSLDNNDDSLVDDDLLWYQIPTVIKGCKMKLHNE